VSSPARSIPAASRSKLKVLNLRVDSKHPDHCHNSCDGKKEIHNLFMIGARDSRF
jgi:hypothetical protein